MVIALPPTSEKMSRVTAVAGVLAVVFTTPRIRATCAPVVGHEVVLVAVAHAVI